jgi:hypothetical protein
MRCRRRRFGVRCISWRCHGSRRATTRSTRSRLDWPLCCSDSDSIGRRIWSLPDFPAKAAACLNDTAGLSNSEADCRAACLANVARHHGLRLAVCRIGELMGTGARNTMLPGLRRGAEANAFHARPMCAAATSLAGADHAGHTIRVENLGASPLPCIQLQCPPMKNPRP